MQYAGHRRAVEKALDEGRSGGGDGGGGEVGVPAGWSAAAAIEKLEGAIREGEGKRGSALLLGKLLGSRPLLCLERLDLVERLLHRAAVAGVLHLRLEQLPRLLDGEGMVSTP